MEFFKRTLAWLLVLCMMCGFLPVNALAAGNDAPVITGTSDAPFMKGTGGSNSFRIPALVTLSDGTLVAAADARWNTTYDGGGLDTMVAISKDNGATWTHSFANYLGDNGNVYNGSNSSCFIDPALAVTSDDTIYMLVDLYPYGIALNGKGNTSPRTDVGFNDAGFLKLSDDDHSSYNYYLKDHVIYDASNNAVSDYTVDEHFNIFRNDTYVSNLFFSDSPFKVVRTGYLYLTTSTDGGENWSAPQLLDLKTNSEAVCLVGPGRGLVTASGTIIFPIYSYVNGQDSQRTGFIYSNDDGATWNRVNSSISWSSESAVVELWDGTLRFFYRNGTSQLRYADYNMTSGTWGNAQSTGIYCNSNTQISAISLENTIDGQQVILVSCPASSSSTGSDQSGAGYRTNGKIFLFTVGSNNALMKKGEVSVPSVHTANSFMYSCMTALTDASGSETGEIAILYEDHESNWGTGDDSYYEMSYKTYNIETAFHVDLDDEDEDVTPGNTYKNTVTLSLGETFTETVADIYVEDGAKEDAFVSVTWDGTQSEVTTTEQLTAATMPTSGNSIECYITDGDGNYLSLNGSTLTNVTDRANATKWTVTYSGYNSSMPSPTYKITSGNYYIRLNSGTLVAGTANSSNAHYYTAEKGFFCSSNGSNVWIYNNGWTVGNDNGHSAKAYTLETVTEESASSTEVTITAKAAGKTTVKIGDAITYNVTVNPAANTENVILKVDEDRTITDSTGNYGDNIAQRPDESIATMTVNGTTIPATKEAVEIITREQFAYGTSYLITTRNGMHVLTDVAYDSSNNALKIGDQYSVNSTELWTFNAPSNGNSEYYTITRNGKYLNIADGRISMSTTPQDLRVYRATFTPSGGSAETHWVIADGRGNSLNNSGQGNQKAGEYSPDAGGLWRIYEIVETPAQSYTEITFSGVKTGKTSAVVGDTAYNIIVTPENVTSIVEIELNVGESEIHTDNTGIYEDVDTSALDPDIAAVEITGTETTTEKHLSDKVASIQSGKTYVLYNKVAQKLMNNQWADASVGGGGTDGLALSSTKNNFQANDCWTITAVTGGYHVQDMNGKYLSVARGKAEVKDNPVVIALAYDGTDWTIGESGEYLNDFGGKHSVAAGWNDINDVNSQWEIYEVITTVTSTTTEITFTGVSVGETFAVVGNTLYDITVNGAVVDIELEIGENFSYTDTTGNHVDDVKKEPDRTYATMILAAIPNSTEKNLVEVTSASFTNGKRYVLENIRAEDNQSDHSVLTSTEANGGLYMNGPLDVASSQSWIITPSNGKYLLSRDSEYVNIGDETASMESTAQQLTFEYVAGSGWLIYLDASTDYYLSDLRSHYSQEAYGYYDRTDGGNYWKIYEIVEEVTSEATNVTFTGVAEGRTIAVVGSTQYNITVVPVESDDEVMNSGTGIWTVDPEIQRQRYNSLIGLNEDDYTDESWSEYEAARQAAFRKLAQVTNSKYTSEADANAALTELTGLIDDLETAKNKLVSAKVITILYTYNGTVLDTRAYKALSNANTLTLPDTIVVDNNLYSVTDTDVTLNGNSEIRVPVTLLGALGSGFVASKDLLDSCDLVAGSTKKKITEMTVTVGISYDLDLATDTSGKTVEWSSGDNHIATVDSNGNVTAVGAGTTYITATITDRNGNVEINTIPITVFPRGTGTRETAIYIEEVDNTTVWCVINADTTNRSFTVVEGELIYGQFDTTVQDNTKTTAFSFFGAPDETHALVYMKSTNSAEQYYQLHDAEGKLYDGTVNPSKYYYVSGLTGSDGGAGWWQTISLLDNQEVNTPERWAHIKAMVQWAIDLGCDGGLGFTRRLEAGSLSSNLSFASDPMPTIEKTVDGVLPTSRKYDDYRRYVDNMVAAVKEQVYFKITVTLDAPSQWRPLKDANGNVQRDGNGNIITATDSDGNPYSAITYDAAMIVDDILPGGYLYTKDLDNEDGAWDGEVAVGSRKNQDDITAALNAGWTEKEREDGCRILEYYLRYEIQETDIPKFWIDNIANLSYGYESAYSTGTLTGSADAEATISVVGSAIDSVVIDFGQSVTYTGLTNAELKGVFVDDETEFVAQYGDVEVHRTPTGGYDSKGNAEYDYTVTYTPHSILHETDAVLLYGLGENDQKKIINGFLVYPASTVYYEEGFLLNDSATWPNTGAKKATTEQTFELLGKSQFDQHGVLTHYASDKKHPYGFDPIYDGDPSNGEVTDSFISTAAAGDNTSFSFTGTGFELYANCDTDSGWINVSVMNEDGESVKMLMVNTVVKSGNSSSTNEQTGEMKSLPIVSLKDLEHGTYTVNLRKVMPSGTVTIDGVRIINTLADSTIYTVDLEDNPEFYQLRDVVLHSIGIGSVTDSDYGDLTGKAQQVYNDLLGEYRDENGNILEDTELPTALISTPSDIYGSDADLQDLLDNGPKNELYLWPGQTLSFNVSTQRVMQIGLKAPRNDTVAYLSIRDSLAAMPSLISYDISANTDMFYYVTDMPVMDANNTYLVSITNDGNDVLAVTDLKVCDDPTAAFKPLTLDDVRQILSDAGYTDEDTDVPEEAFYTKPLQWAIETGVTTSTEDAFDPSGACVRAMVVTFLWRAMGEPEPASTYNPFVDVTEEDYFYKPVLWAVEQGITTGITPTRFAPADQCNRAQFVTFLYRAMSSPAVNSNSNPFSDVNPADWYGPAVLWAVEQGITTGISPTRFAPADQCNRAQVITFLYRALAD